VNWYGRASRLPSSAWNVLAIVTVYDVPGVKDRAGVKRTVIGSRHSTIPSTAGSIRKIALGSTASSTIPITGRSNVTSTAVVGSASPIGTTRRTLSP
jgi:hypothetical protein